jgi:hypothetical protein
MLGGWLKGSQDWDDDLSVPLKSDVVGTSTGIELHQRPVWKFVTNPDVD